MRNNNIRGLLKIPGYKIKGIDKTETQFEIQIEPYKRNQGICSEKNGDRFHFLP